jgi:hypothetical protein
MKNLFSADFDKSAIPSDITRKATRWYSQSSPWFTFQMAIGSMLLLSFLEPILRKLDYLPLILEIIKWFIAMMVFTGIASVIYTHWLARNRKRVVIEYLEQEIKRINHHLDFLYVVAVNDIDEIWHKMDLQTQKKLIMMSFSKLSAPEQEVFQDLFLDILLQKEIDRDTLPAELWPSVDVKTDAIYTLTIETVRLGKWATYLKKQR